LALLKKKLHIILKIKAYISPPLCLVVLAVLLLDGCVSNHRRVSPSPGHQLLTSPGLGEEESTGARTGGCRGQSLTLSQAEGLSLVTINPSILSMGSHGRAVYS